MGEWRGLYFGMGGGLSERVDILVQGRGLLSWIHREPERMPKIDRALLVTKNHQSVTFRVPVYRVRESPSLVFGMGVGSNE